MELFLHIPVVILVIIDLCTHYLHHRKKKNSVEELYTLDQARIILFNEALNYKKDGRLD